MGGVFINYRRGEASGEARALFGDLCAQIGADSVFMDVDSIALGRDFREVLRDKLGSVDVMLTLIGKGWAQAKDPNGNRRLDDPNDFVRREIRAALERNIALTPVLLQGASMPLEKELPEDIRDLAYRNGFELSHERWGSDVHEMFKRLRLERPTEAAPLPPTTVPKDAKRTRWGLIAVICIVAAAAIGTFFYDRQVRLAAQDRANEEERVRAEKTKAELSERSKAEATKNGPKAAGKPVALDPKPYSSGTLVVRGTWTYDLDEGAQVSDQRRADVWWEQVDGTKRYLVPKNGASFVVIGSRDFDSIGPSVLQRLQLSTQKIDGSDLAYNQIPPGTVVGYKTKEGRLGKFVVDDYGYNLTIRWVTFAGA